MDRNVAKGAALQPLSYAQHHGARFLNELIELVRFPTISAQPRHSADLKQCAAWLANHLREIGLDRATVVPTDRHPLVYAEWRHRLDRPTVLIYGHYDVQPVDPLDEWDTPPFEPLVRDNDLYGRGASDDKGQFFTHIKALESFLQTACELPANVICLFEGEEETGSRSLIRFIERNRKALKADVAVLSDMRILAPDRPAITYALRGALSLELEVSGPDQDLHSGTFGGAIHNPLQALCEMIAQLHDANGRITIPGFYKRVRRLSRAERAYMAQVGPSDQQFLQDAQGDKGWGEVGFTLYERSTLRPALTVNGIVGGYQGPGSKAVVPARAVAKISFRLVLDQDPREIERLFRQHIARITPSTVRSAVRTSFMAKPAVVERSHPAMRAAQLAYHKAFGAEPVFLASGGTIPVVNTFQESLGGPTVLMGFALPDDRMHAPNEKFHLPNFFKGIATSIWFLAQVGAMPRPAEQPMELASISI